MNEYIGWMDGWVDEQKDRISSPSCPLVPPPGIGNHSPRCWNVLSTPFPCQTIKKKIKKYKGTWNIKEEKVDFEACVGNHSSNVSTSHMTLVPPFQSKGDSI